MDYFRAESMGKPFYAICLYHYLIIARINEEEIRNNPQAIANFSIVAFNSG